MTHLPCLLKPFLFCSPLEFLSTCQIEYCLIHESFNKANWIFTVCSVEFCFCNRTESKQREMYKKEAILFFVFKIFNLKYTLCIFILFVLLSLGSSWKSFNIFYTPYVSYKCITLIHKCNFNILINLGNTLSNRLIIKNILELSVVCACRQSMLQIRYLHHYQEEMRLLNPYVHFHTALHFSKSL